MLKIPVKIENAGEKASCDGMKNAKISSLQVIQFKVALFINNGWKYRNYLFSVTGDAESYMRIRIF